MVDFKEYTQHVFASSWQSTQIYLRRGTALGNGFPWVVQLPACSLTGSHSDRRLPSLSVAEGLSSKSVFGDTSVLRLTWKEMKQRKTCNLKWSRVSAGGAAKAVPRGRGPPVPFPGKPVSPAGSPGLARPQGPVAAVPAGIACREDTAPTPPAELWGAGSRLQSACLSCEHRDPRLRLPSPPLTPPCLPQLLRLDVSRVQWLPNHLPPERLLLSAGSAGLERFPLFSPD